jgi:TrmH family RNA methyltransferase
MGSNFKTMEVYALKDFILQHTTFFNGNFSVNEISEKELHKISTLKTPNQAVAIVEIPNYPIDDFSFDSLSLVLDNIQDPGNLGTIIRTANWYGVEYIFCSTDTVDAYNSKVIQSTMGAIFRTKVIYGDLLPILSKAKTHHQAIYGTLLDGHSIYNSKLTNNGLIVLGNESKGISQPIQKLIDHKIRIPNFPENSTAMESLNVGVANAIVLAEFRRPFIS